MDAFQLESQQYPYKVQIRHIAGDDRPYPECWSGRHIQQGDRQSRQADSDQRVSNGRSHLFVILRPILGPDGIVKQTTATTPRIAQLSDGCVSKPLENRYDSPANLP
jgi:hypothetical protein